MENPQKNPSLSIRGVGDSLKILRASRTLFPPFSAQALMTRFDLLHLPFLDGVDGVELRIERLQLALRLVADLLGDNEEIVYREVFLDPTAEKVGERMSRASRGLARAVGHPDSEATPKNAEKINEQLPKLIAQALLSKELAERLDEDAPIHRRRVDTVSTASSVEAYELLDYRCDCDIDDDDPRKQRELRKAKLRVLLPHQRVIGIRYHTPRRPVQPMEGGVRLMNREHTYLGALPDAIEGSPIDWWMHFVHLGRRRQPGNEVAVEMVALYLDQAEGNRNPFVAMTVRFESLQTIDLGLRLPANKRKDAKPVARVIKDPFSQEPETTNGQAVDKEWPLEVLADGWIRCEFGKLSLGQQYGIFLPVFDLYN